MKPTFIGIDLGTSGCRGCLIDNSGQILTEARTDLPEPVIDGSKIEQDSALWWNAVIDVLQLLCQHTASRQLAAVAVDGTSATLLVTDQDGQALGPALMYNDARANEQTAIISQHAPADAAVHSSTSSLAKLLWLQQQSLQAGHALHQADYILGKLCGRYGISDENNCLKLGYDPRSKQWPEWLSDCGVQTNLLPEVFEPGTVIGQLKTELCQQLAIPKNVQVVTGTTDSIAGFLATGASEPGDAVTSLGSTLVLKVISDKPVYAPEYGIYSHRIHNHWLAGGASNAGGAVLKQMFDQQQLDELSRQLNFEQATGLSYYPLLKPGERFPDNNPAKLPCLSPRPDDDAVYLQAILESLTQIEHDGYQKLAQLGAPYPTRIFTVGGGSQNNAWLQHRQQQLNTPVLVPEHTEACYGSALLAKQGYTQWSKHHDQSI